MVKKFLFAVFLLCSYAAHAADTDEADFDKICKIYTGALNSTMNIEQLSDYIFSNVAQRVKSRNALDAHEAVMQVEPVQRYNIFKQSAELALKHPWNCAAMQQIMKTTQIPVN
jgi:hypothetical protein